MAYESPVLRQHGTLGEVLLRLLPPQDQAVPNIDVRVRRLVQSIDIKIGSTEWDLEDACRELKLDISSAHAARLFKRYTGMGVREYAKKKRLTQAAKRLIATNLSIKAIAAEFGYRKPVDFARTFKQQYHLTPSQFRRTA
jgi:AraC-like DNA-binding protein